MPIVMKNMLTVTRVQYLAILIFAEAFLIPLQNTLSSGRFPNAVELCLYSATGALQSVTLLLALLKKEEDVPQEAQVPANKSMMFKRKVVWYIRHWARTGFYTVR